jgi:pimeloyl-ACP methyl ester carboxylesterase
VKPGSFEYPLTVLRSWNRGLDELQAALPRISHLPTLMIWGDRDAAVHPASASQLCRNFPDHQLIVMSGVGHLPYEEVPEEFNRVVGEFLSKPRKE